MVGSTNANNALSLLWTNPNPSSSFANQQISGLSVWAYKALLVIFHASTSSSTSISVTVMRDGNTYNAFNFSNLSSGTLSLDRRGVTASSTGSAIEITDNYNKPVTETTRSVTNTNLIPYQIYGIH